MSVGPTLITLFALPQEAGDHLHSVFILLKQILTTPVYFERGRVERITALSASQMKRDMLVIGFTCVDFSQQVTQQCLPGNTVALLIKHERYCFIIIGIWCPVKKIYQVYNKFFLFGLLVLCVFLFLENRGYTF